MTLRGFSILAILAVAAILYLWHFPLGTRNAQSDIKGGDKYVIPISRPHYIIPREFLSRGGMNPFNFWSHAPDPWFRGNQKRTHDFLGIDGLVKHAEIQGFEINRTMKNPQYREAVLAIRVDEKIFDFRTPHFQYSVGAAANEQFYFIGQDESNLYYYYPLAIELGYNLEAIIKLKLPLEDGVIEIVRSDKVVMWKNYVDKLGLIDKNTAMFDDLCRSKELAVRKFIDAVFDRKCDDID